MFREEETPPDRGKVGVRDGRSTTPVVKLRMTSLEDVPVLGKTLTLGPPVLDLYLTTMKTDRSLTEVVRSRDWFLR